MASKTEITLPDEFASTMQQLVAEAEKVTPPPAEDFAHDGTESDALRQGFAGLAERMVKLERLLSTGLEKIGGAESANDNFVVEQLQRVDEHLIALRSTESVNQRLFNSLHQELKSYRDNFLRESLQKPFIRDLVVLYDDLSSLSAQMEAAGESAAGKGGKGGTLALWRSNIENANHSLLEILHRMEVTEIEPKEMVDRALHRVVSFEPADYAEDDGRIVMRIKRGFVWREQVLRPEEVVAKRFG